MNKFFTISIIFFTLTLFSQTYTSGLVTLSSTSGLVYNAKLDITATEVTLTLEAPSDRWFAIGFGGSGMGSVTDAFVFNNTSNFDRKIIPYDVPTLDANQDWTIISNTVTADRREIIATRALDTGETDDFVFTHSDTTIPVIWARGDGATYSLAYHGANKNATTLSFTVLGLANNNMVRFAMYPNPTKTDLNIVLPSNIDNAMVSIYDVLGKKVIFNKLNNTFNLLDVKSLKSGIYFVKVFNNNAIFETKQFIKN